MPLLELRDVEARYGAIRALHGVSLSVDEGEVVALLGANGAGKTTTLRAVSGRSARRGEVTFDGKPIADCAPSPSRGSASRTCPRAAVSSPS